ncbi:CoA transferase [Nocardioides sp. zg-579]|uniref:CoA transferase n=1 Tax=Nocardioides marmotae TaxID=2663857 RepID=A0A6I3J961_9ACTN|nr:CaiB/BaiF CoA-transferase family protein [Nocardioides marmotae]MCR6030077.1 CoA transferase [Gordonia jinghuaiqii]MTB93708.1 CoA transferase [Nocardioides marmotae]QKE00053.1 CoA transferase [Nocardioides marmotae]
MPDVLPLSGITVVSLEQAVAAPFATRQLADLGARVIKVERPGAGDFARRYDEAFGPGMSSYFTWLNRSKESLTLDVKTPAGRDILHTLVAKADVVVQNLAPGAARRLGLAADLLAATHPDLIMCDISGYGADGPWTDEKAYDLLVQCETGLVSVTGSQDSPAKVGISVADISAGMYAYSGILTSLYVRATTGRVEPLEISLFESLAEWMGSPMYYAEGLGIEPARVGLQHATIAPYGPYPASTGSLVLLSIQNDREWESLCTSVLGKPQLLIDPRFVTSAARVAHRDELNAEISAVTSTLSDDALVARLTAAAIANARIRTVQEFLDHPVLEGRKRWRTVGTPTGPVRALVPPATTPGREPRMDPVPAVGEHTDSILAEIGWSASDITSLHERGIA